MSDGIQQLDDAQLDGIVGGSGLSGEFGKYQEDNGTIRVCIKTDHSESSKYIQGDRMKEFLATQQKRGVTQIGLYPKGSNTVEMHAITELQNWCN